MSASSARPPANAQVRFRQPSRRPTDLSCRVRPPRHENGTGLAPARRPRRRGSSVEVAAPGLPSRARRVPHAQPLPSSRRDGRPKRRSPALVRLAAACTRRLGARRLWEPAPLPEPVAPDKLLRVIRYVHLNPPRAHLVDDLLSYRWSTHRGVIGAEYDPWVSMARIAQATGRPWCGFVESFHEYVSSDPSVSPVGTPFPNARRRAAAP